MADRGQLPSLLKLLDDETPDIRAAAIEALAEYGDQLAAYLDALHEPPSAAERQRILRLVATHHAPSVATTPRRFGVGQLVRHRRYNYRGVIASLDLSCQADEDWYQRNRTQPERNQPWYHVLVHNSFQVTYAAQTSIEADPTPEPVRNPLVPHFFHEFHEGAYRRNDRPWPFC